MTTTPMMRQYEEAKAACGDCILLFRMGDFYELFYEDAKTAARVLGLTLTSRDKGENPIPMAGFPHHQLEGYLGKLIRQGYRAAVCEQVEDPREAKGIVKREVTRIVTPGTLTDDALLDPRQSNILAAVCSFRPGSKAPNQSKAKTAAASTQPDSSENHWVGIAWAELSTGRFEAGIFPKQSVRDELYRIEPSEVLLREDDGVTLTQDSLDPWMVTLRPAWQFGVDESLRNLHEQFGVLDLQGMGWEQEDQLALGAAGAVLAYLKETQRSSLAHIQRLLPHRRGHTLEIDSATRRSLELTHTIRSGQREGSLLSILDHTVTPMGSRLLANWLANPLIQRENIEQRLSAVEELIRDTRLRQSIRHQLKDVYDLQRLLARIATSRTNPRDLNQVGRTLRKLPQMKTLLSDTQSVRLQELGDSIDLCLALSQQLQAALMDDCPLLPREGGFIRADYNAELDELRQLATGGKQWIAEYQAQLIQSSGISSLKVGYTKVFGYYLEVTNTHREKIPDYFIRKQTLKNAERYITPELKDYEEKVLSADDRAKQLEYDLFLHLREAVFAQTQPLNRTALVLSELDALSSLAEIAAQRGYVRPTITDETILEIQEGRHPVLDASLPQGTFVPNDIFVGMEHGRVMLITGPNMAGKSTYIRQVALLTILAQMGSFVPAKSATIGIADKIFARVGASDELARGQSTFMVEMLETARILNTATHRSLIILDEIGRGTSTYDGLSLAWAIVEHLHDQIGARTYFATHYHELVDLEQSLVGVKNLNVAVKEWNEDVVFLHRIVRGGADKSYGIHVARLAGIPTQVNDRAKDILTQLEIDHINKYGQSKITPPPKKSGSPIQLTLFDWGEHPVLDRIRDTDLSQTTPLQALQRIEQWQKELGIKNSPA
jgi:DNA mismatch repair protein MutS